MHCNWLLLCLVFLWICSYNSACLLKEATIVVFSLCWMRLSTLLCFLSCAAFGLCMFLLPLQLVNVSLLYDGIIFYFSWKIYAVMPMQFIRWDSSFAMCLMLPENNSKGVQISMPTQGIFFFVENMKWFVNFIDYSYLHFLAAVPKVFFPWSR